MFKSPIGLFEKDASAGIWTKSWSFTWWLLYRWATKLPAEKTNSATYLLWRKNHNLFVWGRRESYSFQSTCQPRGLIITLILLHCSRLGVFKPPGALTYCLLTDCLQHAIMPETGFFVLFFIVFYCFFITRLPVIAIHLFSLVAPKIIIYCRCKRGLRWIMEWAHW